MAQRHYCWYSIGSHEHKNHSLSNRHTASLTSFILRSVLYVAIVCSHLKRTCESQFLTLLSHSHSVTSYWPLSISHSRSIQTPGKWVDSTHWDLLTAVSCALSLLLSFFGELVVKHSPTHFCETRVCKS